jgi:hypothetical protein
LQHCPAPALTSVGKMADTDGSMHKFTDFCQKRMHKKKGMQRGLPAFP